MKYFKYNLITPNVKKEKDPFSFHNDVNFKSLFHNVDDTNLCDRKETSIKLTIIIPNFNNGNYLMRSIESLGSLLNNKDVEILIVDDCSNDNSKDIIDSLNKKYNNIYKIIFLENAGVSIVRNFALYCAKGKYTFFIDADDYLINSEELISMVNYAIENDIDLLNSNPQIRYSESNTDTKLYIESHYNKIKVQNSDAVPRMALQGFWLHGRLFKTKLIVDNYFHFPNIKYSEDDKFMQDVYRASKKVGFWNQSIYMYNREPENSSITSSLNDTIEGKINLLVTRIAIMDYHTRKNSEFYDSLIGKKIIARKLEFNIFAKFLENKELINLVTNCEDMQLLYLKCIQLLKRAKENGLFEYFIKDERIDRANELTSML